MPEPSMTQSRWRLDGVRVVHANELDINTPQTPGMNRAAAITYARAARRNCGRAPSLSTPKPKRAPIIMDRWGDRLEFVAEAGPGDFIYVPPFVPHQEINASDDQPLSCVLVRSGQEPVVVNLHLPNVESNPEEVRWVDDIHPPATAQ